MTTFERATELPVSAEEAFRWHARPGAFERLTPPWEPVDVVQPAAIEDGALAILRMRLGPFSTRWNARHLKVRDGRGFVDVMERGPFAAWEHDHSFEPAAEGSVLTDHIEYRLPLAPFSRVARGFVEKRLDRMFRYRHRVTHDDLSFHKTLAAAPQKVGITGASGLIGSALSPFLSTGGHSPSSLSRRPTADELRGLDAVVHLAGEPINGFRWTEDKKRRILESRREGTLHLARALAALDEADRPRVLLSASGTNYYGHRGDELLPEDAGTGGGFLAEVSRAWEESCQPARDAGVRVASFRTGIVLAGHGGALPRMALPFKLGGGGPLGNPDNYLPWIHLDDVVRSYTRALVDERMEGAINLVAGAVTQAELADALGRVLRRPSFLRAPAFALKAVLGGEQASELLLTSMRVEPAKLRELGVQMRFPDLEEALRDALGRD